MTPNTNFGLKISELIKSRRDTLEEAGKKVGLTKSSISKIMEREDVSTALLKRFGEAYGVGLGYFFRDFVMNQQVGQNVGIQAIGEKIMHQQTIGNNSGITNKADANTELLNERIKGLEKENALLRDMVDILKNR